MVRHLWWWLGGRPASAATMHALLREGACVLVCPGGVRECLHMEKGREAILLHGRTGFVRIAMQHGVLDMMLINGASMALSMDIPWQIVSEFCVIQPPGLVNISTMMQACSMPAGAPLVPVFVFGQTDAYGWVKLGPPLLPQWLTQRIASAIGFLPLFMYGLWGTPLPHKVWPRLHAGSTRHASQWSSKWACSASRSSRRVSMTFPGMHAGEGYDGDRQAD
jgi:2-acylglycerol O-acyltransferase 2